MKSMQDKHDNNSDNRSSDIKPMNKSFIENKKTQFEKRFFNGRPVEYLQATHDMWDFITQTLKEFSDELRLEKSIISNSLNFPIPLHPDKVLGIRAYEHGYNQAVSDLNEKIDSLLGGEK